MQKEVESDQMYDQDACVYRKLYQWSDSRAQNQPHVVLYRNRRLSGYCARWSEENNRCFPGQEMEFLHQIRG